MKAELLSPVGNMKMLYQAIHNGADAVYLGGKNFGARKYSENFTNEELKEAVRYAHLFGVKVYVTVNTIIYENETKEFLEYIFFLNKISVDALIMQDIGMIKVVLEKFPNLIVHASTQCHNHNDEGIKFLKSLGVTRVVLDREMSLEEIKKLDTNIEKEIFVYGALCVSYSGCCLFSSLNGGRSGNRGECTQCCRMPYELYENDKKINTDGSYLLSTKDLNTISRLKEILESGITSLKIEGRMKSPEYVGYVTKIYRRLIDNFYEKKEMTITKEEEDNLKLLFNRQFTLGYLFKEENIMNTLTPNHIGIEIGKVIKADKNKIYIKLDKTLNQEDGIRFKNKNVGMIVNKLYNEDDLLCNNIVGGNIAVLDNKLEIKEGDIVLKTSDKLLFKEINNIKEKKIGIDINVKVKENNLKITITDVDGNIVETNTKVEEAKTMPVSLDTIKNSLSKLGDTIYKLDNFNINYNQDIFIPISSLNEIRRNMLLELDEKRIDKNSRKIILNSPKENIKIIANEEKIKISILIRNETQLKAAIKNNVDIIYTTKINLYNKYKEKCNIYYKTPRVINKFISIKNGNILASELGSINKYRKDNNVNVDYTLNIVNTKSIELLNSLDVKTICLSPELDYLQIKNIMKKNYNVELLVYGKVELMIMKYCPLKVLLNNCQNCQNNNNSYYLVDKFKHKFKILKDNCLISIMHYKNTDLTNDLEKYQNLNIYNYRIDLLDETEEEVTNIINKVRNKFIKKINT